MEVTSTISGTNDHFKVKIKTPLAYYGGNQSILSHILPIIPYHSNYSEEFIGGGSVLWAKEKVKNELINDKNDIVVNFYEVLKRDYKNLKKLIDESLLSKYHHKKAGYILQNKDKFSKIELAWALWMRANFSFANKLDGGLKFSNHQSTVPADQMQHKKERFTEILQKRIEHLTIENTDACKILKKTDTITSFHFLDPPYSGADQGHYKGYTDNDLIDLLDVCKIVKGKFLLLNYQSEILVEYINKHEWKSKLITHRIQAPRKSGNKKQVIMVYNYDPTRQMSVFEEKNGYKK